MAEAALARSHIHVEPRAQDRLIVALDFDTVAEALNMVGTLGNAVSFYKIGLSLQIDPDLHVLVNRLAAQDKKLFIDFKTFDIAATVERAVRAASKLGFYFITVVGQQHIIEAAVMGRGSSDLKILVVTLLTGMNERDMQEEYNTGISLQDFIVKRAQFAAKTGCDGVISSAREAELIKRHVTKPGFLVVTPGIRPAGSAHDDQKRVAEPHDAIVSGADYLVIGRPIIHHKTPAKAAINILEQMQGGFYARAKLEAEEYA
jgi:orotidine-5'-phosphate decarboxylase